MIQQDTIECPHCKRKTYEVTEDLGGCDYNGYCTKCGVLYGVWI